MQATGKQFLTVEDSMGSIDPSKGFFSAAPPDLMSDVAILCNLAHVTLGSRTTTNWLGFAADYNLIRDAISRVIPGIRELQRTACQGEILLSAKCGEAAHLEDEFRESKADGLPDPKA